MYSALMYFLEPEEDEEGGGGFEAVFFAVALYGDTQTERYVCLQSLMGGGGGGGGGRGELTLTEKLSVLSPWPCTPP